MRTTLSLFAVTLLSLSLFGQSPTESRILDDPRGFMAQIAEQAFLLKPNKADVVASCGHLFFASGNRKKAEELFERALLIKPKNAEIRHIIAKSYLQFGTREEALKAYHKMVLADPTDKDSMINACRELFEVHETEEAIRMAQRAYALNPKDRGNCITIALIAFGAGEPELGAKYIQRAKEVTKSTDADDLLEMAMILADQEKGNMVASTNTPPAAQPPKQQ